MLRVRPYTRPGTSGLDILNVFVLFLSFGSGEDR